MSTYNQAASFIAELSCVITEGVGTLTAGKLKPAKASVAYHGYVDVSRVAEVHVCEGARELLDERFWFGCFNSGEPERYDVRCWAPGKPHHGKRLTVASDGGLSVVPAAAVSCEWLLSWGGQPFQRRHVSEMGGAGVGLRNVACQWRKLVP